MRKIPTYSRFYRGVGGATVVMFLFGLPAIFIGMPIMGMEPKLPELWVGALVTLATGVITAAVKDMQSPQQEFEQEKAIAKIDAAGKNGAAPSS